MTIENDIKDTKALFKNELISHKISILMFGFVAMTSLSDPNINLAFFKEYMIQALILKSSAKHMHGARNELPNDVMQGFPS